VKAILNATVPVLKIEMNPNMGFGDLLIEDEELRRIINESVDMEV